ncbi:amine oxidase [Athelia psychrophila]|uniref:Amine oxidase n=1 Tax=Athelia psychrophila TaxID=1759441 RepID=A0A165ZHS8_9AGAM|nr:amine oxidase [Fibularhizoctonia sp. CBS 109695]
MASGKYGPADPITAETLVEACVRAPPNPKPTQVDDRCNTDEPAILPVAILGAGVGGLYTAMILESLGIEFKIIEATGRVGGRLRTHKFSDDDAQYYDVGAMRFPIGLPIMSRLKKLFELPAIQPNITLIPYKFISDSNVGYLHYNGVRRRRRDVPTPDNNDIFRFSAVGVPQVYLDVGYDRIVKDVRKKWVTLLAADLEPPRGTAGWDELMTKDAYSTRAYMAVDYQPSAELNLPAVKGLPNDVINWCETMSGSTAVYDGAFTQTILGAMAFGATDSGDDHDWKCIVGGSSKLTDVMASTLKTTIVHNAQVTAIGLKDPNLGINSKMTVTSLIRVSDDVGSIETEDFEHVISTLPLPVLRSLDLSKSDLTSYQQHALRQLQYKDSVKVGVQFKSAWWTNGIDKDGQPIGIVGGQSFTDMPIRTVVYPSYGPDRSPDEPAVLIASYCTTEDAQRFAGLVAQFNASKFDPAQPLCSPLASLVLRNLAEVHNVDVNILTGQVIAIHAWDWNADPYAMGCSAFFGPGDFEHLYPHMCRPAASGRLHFAGDAISARHAWVVGALDSAWRAVEELLIHSTALHTKLPEFWDRWGVNKSSSVYDGARS